MVNPISKEIEPVSKLFTRGFVRSYGTNLIPEEYAHDLRNVRIENGIKIRPGFNTVYEDNTNVSPITEIRGNERLGVLYIINDSKIYSIDPDAGTISASLGTVTASTKHRVVVHGKYNIILSGTAYPYRFDGSTLAQLTSSDIAVNTNPSFGTSFAGFVVVNSTLDKNAIIISSAITLAAQTNAYQFTGGTSNSIIYQSEVVALVSGQNYLWVFTKTTVEYMTRDNLSTTGGISSTYTITFAEGEVPASPDCIAVLGDMVFYLTADKKIAAINYSNSSAAPSIDRKIVLLSSAVGTGIQRFLDEELDDDQSTAFVIGDSKKNLVKFFVKSNNSSYEDICVLYDVVNETFLLDDGKYYADICRFNNKYYASSPFGLQVVEDEVGLVDDDVEIAWRFETQDLNLKKRITSRVCWREYELGGQINSIANINVEVYVDGRSVSSKTISGSSITSTLVTGAIGTYPVGTVPVGGPTEYEDDMEDREKAFRIKATGKKIKFVFSGSTAGGKMVLDYLALVRSKKRKVLSRDRG